MTENIVKLTTEDPELKNDPEVQEYLDKINSMIVSNVDPISLFRDTLLHGQVCVKTTYDEKKQKIVIEQIDLEDIRND